MAKTSGCFRNGPCGSPVARCCLTSMQHSASLMEHWCGPSVNLKHKCLLRKLFLPRDSERLHRLPWSPSVFQGLSEWGRECSYRGRALKTERYLTSLLSNKKHTKPCRCRVVHSGKIESNAYTPHGLTCKCHLLYDEAFINFSFLMILWWNWRVSALVPKCFYPETRTLTVLHSSIIHIKVSCSRMKCLWC